MCEDAHVAHQTFQQVTSAVVHDSQMIVQVGLNFFKVKICLENATRK